MVDEGAYGLYWVLHERSWACLVLGEVAVVSEETWACGVDLAAQKGEARVGVDGVEGVVVDVASEFQVHTSRGNMAAYTPLVGSSDPATQVQASVVEEAYRVAVEDVGADQDVGLTNRQAFETLLDHLDRPAGGH